MKYKKKPVVVEAFQYDGDLKGADGKYYVPDWAAEAYEKGIMYYDLTELFINNVLLPAWVLSKAYLGVTSSIRSFQIGRAHV